MEHFKKYFTPKSEQAVLRQERKIVLLSFSQLKTHLLAVKEINGYHSITHLNEIAS